MSWPAQRSGAHAPGSAAIVGGPRGALRAAVSRVGWVVALAAVSGACVWYFVAEARSERQRAEETLAAIADFKANRIAGWVAEREADSAVISDSPILSSAIAAFLRSPAAVPPSDLHRHLDALARRYGWADILLVEVAGRIRFSLAGRATGQVAFGAALRQALVTGAPALVDLHTDSYSDSPHLAWVAPAVLPGASPAGAVVLVADAARDLYPQVQTWPTPSQTAEALLVRREGDDVVFLNRLRHREGTALSLRFPLATTTLPAAVAVLGHRGVVEGLDYRGVPVVAALVPVPGTPWFLVAKMDKTEILADWHARAWLLVTTLLSLVGLSAGAAVAYRQRERRKHLQTMYEAQAARRASVERHSVTLKAIGDAVITTDAEGHVDLLNPVAEALTGWKADDAIGRPLSDVFRIVSEDTRKPANDPVARVLAHGRVVGLANHTVLIARDGRERPISDSAAPIFREDGSILGVVLVFRDRSEARRVERVRQAQIDLLSHAATCSLDELLTRSLDTISGLMESPIAFYHFMEPDGRTLSLQQWSTRTRTEFCTANAGQRHYDLEDAGVWADAVRTASPVVHNDYETLPNRKGLPAGHAEVQRELVVPILRRDRVVAILGVGNKPRAYTDEDVSTVSYLADATWDIVDRVRVDQALAVSEKRYRRLFETTWLGILLVDYDSGQVVDANPRIGTLIGHEAADLVGRLLWDLASFRALVSTEEGFASLRAHGPEPVAGVPLLHRDGQTVDVDVAVSGYTIDDTRVLQIVMRDVSNEKRHSAERDRLIAAIEQSGEEVMITDPRGILQYVNPAFTAVTGYSREDALGRTPAFLKSGSHDDTFYRQFWSTISSGRVWRGRMVNRRKDGSTYTEEATISPVFDDAGQIAHYVAVKREITQQLALEAQLLQAQKLESIGRLAGGVAHDYNNMLSVILGRAELALARADPADPVREDLEDIAGAAARSIDVTRQLLAFARRQTIVPKTLDLNDTIEGMLKMLRRLIGEDIDLRWLPEGGLWPVTVDPSQIDQILANLCVNARDAISDVGVITIETDNVDLNVDTCLKFSDCSPGPYVRLRVSDNGAGMDRDTVQQIFEPFFTTKAPGQGTGLGLATVYGIVRQNGGFIHVSSEPGKGSTFSLFFPRATGPVDVQPQKPAEVLRARPGETILLVEDEPALLRLTRTMLERLGYRVLAANSPTQAIEVSGSFPDAIDLLVSDVVMPGMNGRDLAWRLQADRPTLRRLFVSGYTADIIADRGGVIDDPTHFLQKPFSVASLAARVRAVLDG